MSKRDYYEVLGLDREATDSDIKRAYRKKARQYHPDVNKEPEAESIFKELSEAYSVLSDDQQRAAYDRFGHDGLNGAGFGGAGFGGGFEGFGGLGDIFEAFFGGSRGDPFSRSGPRNRAERGSDLRVDMEVDFRDAIFGAEKEIKVQHLEFCEECDGKGVEKGTELATCGMCRGSGQIQQHQRTAFGTFAQITTCPKCQGKGNIAEHPCKPCKGQGRQQKKKTLKVKVPAGIDSGVRLCVTGEGDAGLQGGPPGDLYIVLHVLEDPDKVFERRENHLYAEVPISYSQAALGAKIQVPTLEGPTTLDVPSGTQPGTVFKLKNKGVPFLNHQNSRGDLNIKVNVAVPTKVSSEEKSLLESLQALQGESGGFSFTEGGGLDTHTEEKHGSFFDTLKNVWKSNKED